MLITIIVAVGVVAAAAGVIGARREPEPAMIPARVEQPRRRRG